MQVQSQERSADALVAGRRGLRLSCLWPGLAPLWFRGSWAGLALATSFTLLFNLLTAATLVWTELVHPVVRSAGWVVMLLFWAASVVGSSWWLRNQALEARQEGLGNLFSEAIHEYLQGHWFEAEFRLRRLLAADERDVDALLLLATLLRHTQRWDEADERLTRLAGYDEAAKWQHEIAYERSLLAKQRHAATVEDMEADVDGSDGQGTNAELSDDANNPNELVSGSREQRIAETAYGAPRSTLDAAA